MAHLSVVDGRYSLQIWRFAANIFNKQSQPVRSDPPAWGLVKGLKTHCKNWLVTKCYTGPGFLEQPRLQRMDVRFGTWNVKEFVWGRFIDMGASK
jgi:hypothetical protein